MFITVLATIDAAATSAAGSARLRGASPVASSRRAAPGSFSNAARSSAYSFSRRASSEGSGVRPVSRRNASRDAI